MFSKFVFLLTLLFQLFIIYPVQSHAVTVGDIIWTNKPKYLIQPERWDWTAESLVLLFIAKAVDILLFFAWTLATVLIIVWWFRYVTYFWDESATKDAKSLILNAVIGLVMVICSALIIQNAERFIHFLLW